MKRSIEHLAAVEDPHRPAQQLMHGPSDNLHFVESRPFQSMTEGLHGGATTQSRYCGPVEGVADVIAALFAHLGWPVHTAAALALAGRDPGPPGYGARGP